MKLYDSVGPNPRIVRMFMAEKGIEMPKQTVDLRKGENREADHLKRNPHGQMPTLELDDGQYLSEITAICEYLEEKNPKPAMIGETPEARAECRMWTRRVDLNIAEPLANGYRFGEALKFFENRILCAPEASPGLKMIAANRLQWLNGQMADGGWQGISVRQAVHAGRHPALLLARIRQPGRPTARCRQQQHRSVDGPCRRAAFGEGVTTRVPGEAQRENAVPTASVDPGSAAHHHSASKTRVNALMVLRCIRRTVVSVSVDSLTVIASQRVARTRAPLARNDVEAVEC
jgi:glutathione S-transferase